MPFISRLVILGQVMVTLVGMCCSDVFILCVYIFVYLRCTGSQFLKIKLLNGSILLIAKFAFLCYYGLLLIFNDRKWLKHWYVELSRSLFCMTYTLHVEAVILNENCHRQKLENFNSILIKQKINSIVNCNANCFYFSNFHCALELVFVNCACIDECSNLYLCIQHVKLLVLSSCHLVVNISYSSSSSSILEIVLFILCSHLPSAITCYMSASQKITIKFNNPLLLLLLNY